jgi:hypothetical protein
MRGDGAGRGKKGNCGWVEGVVCGDEGDGDDGLERVMKMR